jgi:hypothetical protein
MLNTAVRLGRFSDRKAIICISAATPMASSVAPGAVETESKWAENSTPLSNHKFNYIDIFFYEKGAETLTFAYVVGAINLDENVHALEVHGSRRNIQERSIRFDIILNVNEIMPILYLL